MKKSVCMTVAVLLLTAVFALTLLLSACGSTEPPADTITPDDPGSPTETFDVDWEIGADATVSVEGRTDGSLPESAASGSVVTFTVVADSDVIVTVTANQTALAAVGGKYSVTVTRDTTIVVDTVRKSYSLQSVTLALVGGKPCYVIGGVSAGYTEAELRGLYYDFSNYAYYSTGVNTNWDTTAMSYELDLEADGSFTMTSDMSGIPWLTEDICFYPHIGAAGGAGDVKASNGVSVAEGTTVIYNGIRFTLDSSANEWGCASVTTESADGDITVSPSDLAPVAFEEVTLHSYFTEELPRIDINTEGGIPIDDPSLELGYNKGTNHDVMEYDYVNASVSVSDCVGYEIDSTDVINAKVKVRGNYTSTYPKRPIRIKFDKKQKMCGLNNDAKAKNWVLLTEYKDMSMTRNAVADYLGKTILGSDGYYCTDFRYVEVYLNGSYNGLYLLVEQQQVNENRVNIPEPLDPSDYEDDPTVTEEELKNTKIGYLFEYDGYYRNEAELENFAINHSGTLKYEDGSTYTVSQNGYSIASDIYYQEQHDFIQKCTQTIWDVVYDAVYRTNGSSRKPFYTMDEEGNKVSDPSIASVREAVERVVDVRSLVDMFILQEICEDMDLNWSSFYLSLDMSETGNRKLTFVAPWDFDSALGNSVTQTDKFCNMNKLYKGSTGDTVGPNPWLALLTVEDWFWTSVNAKWDALDDAGAFAAVLEMIDVFSVTYADAFARNYERWPQCLGRIEGQQADAAVSCRNQAEAAAYLQSWLSERIENLGRLIDGKVAEIS